MPGNRVAQVMETSPRAWVARPWTAWVPTGPVRTRWRNASSSKTFRDELRSWRASSRHCECEDLCRWAGLHIIPIMNPDPALPPETAPRKPDGNTGRGKKR